MATELKMNLIEILEKEEMARLTAGKTIPAFRAGDTVIVSVNVVEGSRKRVQAFEGVVIARRNRGLNSSFTVRKISSGEGVERTFQLYSPPRQALLPARTFRQGRPHQGTSGPQGSLILDAGKPASKPPKASVPELPDN